MTVVGISRMGEPHVVMLNGYKMTALIYLGFNLTQPDYFGHNSLLTSHCGDDDLDTNTT